MSIILKSGSSATLADVDANKNLKVNLPTTKTQSGFAWLASLNDAGTITGTPDVLAPRTSDDLRLSVGMDTARYDDSFNATAQNTANWKFISVSSMLAAQAGGFLTLNSGTQVVTNGALASMQSWRYVYLQGNTTIHLEFSITFGGVNTPLAGQVMEFGLFVPPATAIAPADGVFWRYTSAGLAGIMQNNGGGETSTAVRACSNFTVDTAYHMKMVIGEDFIDYYVNNIEIGSITVPVGYGAPFLAGAAPISLIARNTGTISGTNGTVLKCSDLHCDAIDLNTGKTFAQIYGGMGRHGSTAQNGATMGGTANFTNNLAIGTAAALSNTTIAAPACIGLGGQATYLPTLTVFNDGLLMSYQNPLGSVSQQPRTLYIGSVRISSSISLGLTGGPVAMQYFLAYGHTAASLATPETGSFTTATTKKPRYIALGAEHFVVTAAIGTGPTAGGVNVTLASPIVINPGEYVAIVAKNIGVVTSAGSITSMIALGSWWE